MNVRDERGSITALVAVVATALVMVAGMAYDGGQVIAAHSTDRNHAERAARAGAQQIDLEHLRANKEPHHDPAAAQVAAVQSLARDGAPGTAKVQRKTVTVTLTHPRP